MKSIRVILNPAAGTRGTIFPGRSSIEQVRAALDGLSLEYELCITRGPRDARELARDAVEAGYRVVVAAGGDGTVHEVAQSLARTETALGILPLGTVMNVARVLRIPRNLEAAAALLKAGRTEQIDLGKVGDEYFVEMGGVGMDAAIFHYLGKIESGRWLSLFSLLRFLLRVKAQVVNLHVDGRQMSDRALMVVVANSPIVGPGLPLAPNADVADRYLDVVIYRRLRPRDLLRFFLGRGRGRPLLNETAGSFRASSLTVESPARLPVHADGNWVGFTPASFCLEPRALRVVVGDHTHVDAPRAHLIEAVRRRARAETGAGR